MSRKQLYFLSLCILSLAVSCARPESGASPFEPLTQKSPQKRPLPTEPVEAPSFGLLADAEFVYGPSVSGFSVAAATAEDSRLAAYRETVGEREMSGTEIVEKVSRDYSLNPRLLMAILDYQCGWVSNGGGHETPFPLLEDELGLSGLFRQLSWLANELNRGFYSRRVGGLERFFTRDGVQVIASQQTNDASVAIQYALAQMLDYHDWLAAVGPLGVYARLVSLFGAQLESTSNAYEMSALVQPPLALPFAEGESWFFTSGPHSAWGDGAAWAALDFAPDEEQFGCYDSDGWVLAAADGLIVRAQDGAVVQDLDGDGFEGTGWTILYMHIAERDRVSEGAYLKAGERIGHPSCEGGPASGVHLHLARRYNGEWIPADQGIPFVLSGWVSAGGGVEYDGTLSRLGVTVEASGFPTDENKIIR